MSKLEMVGRWFLAVVTATLVLYGVPVIVPITVIAVLLHVSHTVSIPETITETFFLGASLASAAAIIVGSAVVPRQHHIVARKIFSTMVVLLLLCGAAYARMKGKFVRENITYLETSFAGVILAWGYYRWRQWLKSGTLF